jgi:hypothetical protein
MFSHMDIRTHFIVGMIVGLAIGFGVGYQVRELISRRRRAIERERQDGHGART